MEYEIDERLLNEMGKHYDIGKGNKYSSDGQRLDQLASPHGLSHELQP